MGRACEDAATEPLHPDNKTNHIQTHWEESAKMEPHGPFADGDIDRKRHGQRVRVERASTFSCRRRKGLERSWLNSPLQHAQTDGARDLWASTLKPVSCACMVVNCVTEEIKDQKTSAAKTGK